MARIMNTSDGIGFRKKENSMPKIKTIVILAKGNCNVFISQNGLFLNHYDFTASKIQLFCKK
jgi:hypothetical protein